MLVAEFENLRIRVEASLNRQLGAFSDERRITKQDLIDGLLTWFLEQQPEVQAMILGQIPPREDLIELVLRRMVESGPTQWTETGKPNQRPRPRAREQNETGRK